MSVSILSDGLFRLYSKFSKKTLVITGIEFRAPTNIFAAVDCEHTRPEPPCLVIVVEIPGTLVFLDELAARKNVLLYFEFLTLDVADEDQYLKR